MFEKTVRALRFKQGDKHFFEFTFEGERDLFKISTQHAGYFTVKISAPIESGTERQNKAAHSLMAAYFATGLHSSPAKNIAEYKLWTKCTWGPCYDWSIHDTPVRVPKSWVNFSKEERTYFLKCLVSDVRQSGAYDEDKNCREIVDGMEAEKNEK